MVVTWQIQADLGATAYRDGASKAAEQILAENRVVAVRFTSVHTRIFSLSSGTRTSVRRNAGHDYT
jgi:hypothetical protein